MSPGSDSRPRRISNAFWVSEFIRTKGQKSLFLNKGREATTLSVQGQAATGVQKSTPLLSHILFCLGRPSLIREENLGP